MAAAELDSNAWYAISETRVTDVNGSLANCLQRTSAGLRVFGCDDELKESMVWQFQPVDEKPGRYVARLKYTGVRQQLSVCWDADEKDSTKTVACLRRTNSDATQMWDLVDWGDGTYDFGNVANGTGYLLDVHPGSSPFMTDDIEGTGNTTSPQPAQRWIMTSHRPVNNRAYSTIYSTEPTATAATTETAGSSPSGGLSAGAAAGIGIGAAIGGIALLGAAFFFWWRRRKTAEDPGRDNAEVKPDPVSAQTQPSEADANPIYEAHSEPPVHEVVGDSRAHRHELP